MICKAPLEYLEAEISLECEICRKKENGKIRSIHGTTCTMIATQMDWIRSSGYAGISSGMFISIISISTLLANEPFALSHRATSKSPGMIGEIGGPRCCKRDSYPSILSAIDFEKEHFGIEMEKPALFKIFCKDDFCNEIRDSKIQEPEAVPPFPLR
ncbi:MAG: DUF5714 domain-containing protein [Christensenellales bacterium]